MRTKQLKFGLLLIVLVISAVYLYMNRGQLAVVRNVGPRDIVLLLALCSGFMFMAGYTFKVLVQMMGVGMTPREIMGLSVMTSMGNYLGPLRPGTAMKAVYLKTVKGMPFSSFTAIFAANTFLGFFMYGITGLLILLWFRMSRGAAPGVLFVPCIVLIAASLIPFFVRRPREKSEHRILAFIHSAVEGLDVLRRQTAGLLLVCLTFVAQFTLISFMVMVAYGSLGKPMTFTGALTIGTFTSISNLVSITPANIGLQEMVMGYLFTINGYDFETGVVGAGIIRVTHITVTFALAPFFSHTFVPRKADTAGE